MFKWVFVVVVLLAANIGIRPTLKDAHQVMVTDELAVAQLEDSDANYIAMRANSRFQTMIDPIFAIGSIGLIGLTLYSDRKKIKAKLQELDA